MKLLFPLVFAYIFLLVGGVGTRAQTPEADSLRTVLAAAGTPDTTRVQLLLRLSTTLAGSDAEAAFEYAERAAAVADRLAIPEYIGKAAYSKGIVRFYQGDYEATQRHFEEALKAMRSYGTREQITKLLNSLGVVAYQRGDLLSAIQYYQRTLDALQPEDPDYARRQAQLLNNIGAVHQVQGDLDRARSYYRQTLESYQALGLADNIAAAHNNLGEVWVETDLDTALYHYQNSLRYYAATADDCKRNYPRNGIGHVYNLKEQLDSALVYLNRALAASADCDDPTARADALQELGLVYRKQNRTGRAVDYLERALTLAREHELLRQQENTALPLYELYRNRGDYQRALDRYEIYNTAHEALFNRETTKRLTAMDAEMEFEKEKQALALAEQARQLRDMQTIQRQRYLNYGAIGGALALALVSFFIYRNYRTKQRANTLLTARNEEIGRLYNRSEKLLLNILPAETAAELKEKGSATPRRHDHVSVLFTDFKGFSGMVETMSPEAVVTALDDCFRAFDAIVQKHKLEKIKTIGDGYMAAAGLPTAQPDHAVRAVAAGLEMVTALDAWTAARRDRGQRGFEVRVGIHSGPVVAGVVGADKFAYDVWGDTVNLASRMESGSLPSRVNISEDTYQALQAYPERLHGWRFESRGRIKSKNMREVEMFFVDAETVAV